MNNDKIGLTEMTPSTLNKTAFPLNSKKRVLYSPNSNSSTPRPSQRHRLDQNQGDTEAGNEEEEDEEADDSEIYSSYDDRYIENKNYNVHQRSLSQPKRSPIEKLRMLASPSSLNKKVTLRRSTGFLNLSIETSPNTQRIVKKLSSKDAMMKSFNDLNFSSNENNENKVPHKNNENKHNQLTPVSASTSPFLKISSKKNKSSKLNRLFTNNPLDSEPFNNLNDNSPSKNAYNKQPSTSNPINNSVDNSFNSSGNITANNNNKTPFTIPSTGFITPASFKSVKPLQTAFSSTGLQSKKSIKASVKLMPETPCKKPPHSIVDVNGSFAGISLNNSASSDNNSLKNLIEKKSSTNHNMKANNTNTAIINHNYNNTCSNKPINKAINTSDLQSCILRFTNEFDDLYDENDNSSTSIFTDEDEKKSNKIVNMIENNSDDVQMFEDGEEMPQTPTKLNPGLVNQKNQLLSQLQKQQSETPTKKPSNYWQRANSQNPSASSLISNKNNLVENSLPSFAPPLKMSGNPNSTSNSPRTPIEFSFNNNTQPTLQLYLQQQYQLSSANSNSNSTLIQQPHPELLPPPLQPHQLEPSKPLVSQYVKQPIVDNHLLSKFGNCELIGTGEFSIVYEIQFEGYKYAVKRTKNKVGGPKTRLRKFEEVEILKKLNENFNDGNDYILNLISYWEFNNYLYIMTDFCENGSLDKFLIENGKISKLDEWRVWKILFEILMGLKYIHSCDILHLDLKPANIFITFDGTLKIGDFGVGCKLPIPPYFDREGDREYIAPEIISKHFYSKAADIFSVGLIMVEIAANIILPDNGTSWQKLRSGDLTDAGKLSSSDLTDLDNSLFSESIKTVGTTLTGISINNVLNKKKIPIWAPSWFFNTSSSLDKLVTWMINPNPTERPSTSKILDSYEVGLVEIRRKSGATIYEGDFGPAVGKEELERELNVLSERGCYKLSDL